MYRRIIAIVLLALAFQAKSQDMPYYVVIGAYSIESNAQRAMNAAHSLNLPAVYAFNPDRKLHYVFIRTSYRKADAYATMKEMRSEGFKDAWVFHGQLNYEAPHAIAVVEPDSNLPITTPPVKISAAMNEDPVDVMPDKPDSVSIQTEVKANPNDAPKPAGKPFFFKLVSGVTGNDLNGQIRLQESDRASQFRPYAANELVYVVPPNNKNGRYYIVCTVVGYKPFKTFFSYKDAERLKGSTIGINQEIILPVQLDRVKKGDYIELEQVKFYTNSDIMTPDSERELKELVALLNENRKYEIRLHGHTNGNQSRDIVSVGDETDLFHTHASNKKYSGSAKDLSALRAESVKKYLTGNGIDEGRIKVRGEGGKQMIFDPKSTLASMNDRVEVEVLRD